MSGRYATVFLIALAFLSILLLNANAAGSISTVPCIITGATTSVGTCIASAFPLSLLGIGLSLLIIAVAFMAGHVLNHAGLRNFYRIELWEVTKSGIIIAAIFSSLVIVSAAANALAGSTPQYSATSQATAGQAITSNLASIYTTADTKYLTPQLQAAEVSFGALLGLSVGVNLLHSIQLVTWLPLPIPTPAGLIGAVQFGSAASIYQSQNYLVNIYGSPTASVINAGIDIETTVLIAFQMQHDLLFIIAAVGLGLFIPIGIVMRAIPFVRGIGGMAIAVGIGLSIIYPTLLVVFNLPVTNYIYTLTSATVTQPACPFSFNLLCTIYNAASYFVNSVTTGIASGTGTIAGLPMYLAFGSQVSLSSELIGSGFWTGFGTPLVKGIFPSLNFVIDNTLMQSVQFLLFVMDIIIAVPLTEGIARLLGGTVRLGVGRFAIR